MRQQTLSPRLEQIWELVKQGKNTKEIMLATNLKRSTVQTYVGLLGKRLGHSYGESIWQLALRLLSGGNV